VQAVYIQSKTRNSANKENDYLISSGCSLIKVAAQRGFDTPPILNVPIDSYDQNF